MLIVSCGCLCFCEFVLIGLVTLRLILVISLRDDAGCFTCVLFVMF